MKLRALLIGTICACSWLPVAPAASGQPAAPRASAELPRQRFRFDAGAALSAPAGIAPDGSICVGTVDGYVHGLGSDGRYAWSHSVQGAITHRPVFAGGHWQVATSSQRIYALHPDGTLSWVFKPLSPVVSELAADASGTLYFVGGDRFLYGVSARGGVSLRAPFGEPGAGPALGADGAIWAKNQAGSVIRAHGQDVRRFAPGLMPATGEVAFGDPETLRDPQGRLWRGRADGVVELRPMPEAAPRTLSLGSAPLLAPAWSSAAHYALFSSRSGLLIALDPPPLAR